MERQSSLASLCGLVRRGSLAAASALALVAAPSALATAPQASAAAAACGHATGPFHVSGTTVRGAGNAVYVPYGITVPDLANYPWTSQKAPGYVADADNKILATADSWCANTVRLQVSQDNLLGLNGAGFNTSYLNVLKAVVGYAESFGLVVVLNDQTETAPDDVTYQLGPTPGTETFWKDMIGPFGSDKQVIFDLFNEPRTYSSGMSESQMWGLWHNGGTFQGAKYIGMAKLAADVRAAGAPNLYWVEGPDYSATFGGLERNGGLLTSPNVVYAIHHPQGGHNTASWYLDFGYLINTGAAPVVDGEWTNYRPWGKPNSECWGDAPGKVPEYLEYLYGHGIGMTAYQLAQGQLVKSSTNLADPTTIPATGWSCTPTAKPSNEGAGALIMNWFKLHNS
jgi:hypothetical protein